MTIYVVLRDTKCFCDSLHIVGIATSKESADYIAAITGDRYSPCHIEAYETDSITPDSMLRYQVVNEGGRLYATYIGDEDEDDWDPELDAEVVYAHSHTEAIDMVKRHHSAP